MIKTKAVRRFECESCQENLFECDGCGNYFEYDEDIYCIQQERMDNLHYHEKCCPVVTDVEERRQKHANNKA